MKKMVVAAQSQTSLIPEFCRGPAALTMAYVMALFAAVLTLATDLNGVEAVHYLGLMLVYLQAIGICAAIALCTLRRLLTGVRASLLFVICWAALILIAMGVAAGSWWLDTHFALGYLDGLHYRSWILRNGCIAGLIALVLLRYFWERHQAQEESRAETEARYLALQARIRPHFLFNALNSLAELIPSKPDVAEDMVVDLADLFRVGLDSRQKLIPLRDEIEIVKGYLRIEEIRLGDKLLVNWEIADNCQDALLPRLTLQPLVENGVLHGVSRLRARGMLHVIVRREGAFLVVDVENPIPPEEAPKRAGTGTAINNIAQRIHLIFGDRAKLILGEDKDEFGRLYRARLRIPYVLQGGAESAIAPIVEEETP